MFVARERELNTLEECYEQGSFQMVPVWGRRRVGKTRLLNEFAASKERVHFFTARQTTPSENLAALSAALLSWYDEGADAGVVNPDAPVFPSFEAAFARAFDEARERRSVLIIDEYPYLAESVPELSSLLQQMIDSRAASSSLMLVLCGSSMSFMEHQVLGEKSPLYGRRSAQLRLDPFDYVDAAKLLGTHDAVRAIELYSLVGGVALYLEQLDAAHTAGWNMEHRVLGQGRFLYGEPASFLLQELSSPASYTAVVDALALGRSRPVEIANATGIQGPNVNEYLKKLIELGVVRRDTPVGGSGKRRVVYRLSDNLFRFWHSFVPRYQQAIELGQEQAVSRRIVQGDWPAYVGHVFEDVCRQWVARRIAAGDIDMLPTRIGSWWGTDPLLREQTDVDVVAMGADGDFVCGECKWTSRPVGADVVETLARRSRLVAGEGELKRLLVFSKAGFSDSARREAARQGNVQLVNASELLP